MELVTGTVTTSPIGIDCGTNCSAAYNSNTSVKLIANAGADSTFEGWFGFGCTTGTVIITADVTCKAKFSITPGTMVTLTTNGVGGGTVLVTPLGVSCGVNCNSYPVGTSVTLEARPTATNGFWSGDCAAVTTTKFIVGLNTMTYTCTASFSVFF